jgi:hypothetical protein
MEHAICELDEVWQVAGRYSSRPVPLQPCTALELVVREHEHDRFAAAALAEEAVLVAICKGPGHCDNGNSELIIERPGPPAVAGHTVVHGPAMKIFRSQVHWRLSSGEEKIGYRADTLKGLAWTAISSPASGGASDARAGVNRLARIRRAQPTRCADGGDGKVMTADSTGSGNRAKGAQRNAQKGEARVADLPTIRQAMRSLFKELEMKLRILKASYGLALLVAFVVAAGAGSKFHGLGN